MDSLTEQCGTFNLTGFGVFEYAPVVWIDFSAYEFFTLDSGVALPITLREGKNWLTAPILPSENDQVWDEAQSGQLADISISLTLPLDNAAIRQTLRKMATYEKFVGRLQTRNGEKYIIGSVPYPLFFSSQFSSTRNTHSLRFSGKQVGLSTGYNF